MKHIYSISHRLMASVLLIGLLLQSCGPNFNHPIQPKTKDQEPLALINPPQQKLDKKDVESLSILNSSHLNEAYHTPLTVSDHEKGEQVFQLGDIQELTLSTEPAEPKANTTYSKQQETNPGQSILAAHKRLGTIQQHISRTSLNRTLNLTNRHIVRAVPMSPSSTTITPHTSQVSGEDNDRCYLAKGGHQVWFQRLPLGEWQAKVKESLPVGFSRTVVLPVYIAPGYDISTLAEHSQKWHKHHIHIAGDSKSSCVWVGSSGLPGGMSDKDPNNNSGISDRKLELEEDNEEGPEQPSLAEKLEALFGEVDDLISKCSQEEDKEQHKAVVNKLSAAKELIEELEGEEDSEEQHGHFKYLYHTQYASYLRMLGKEKEASKHVAIAKKFEEFKEVKEDKSSGKREALVSIDLGKFFIDNNATETERIVELRDEVFAKLKEFEWLEDRVFEDMKGFFKKVNNYLPGNFSGYYELNMHEVAFNNLITEMLISVSDKENKEPNRGSENIKRIVEYLSELKAIADKQIYSIRIKFMGSVLVASRPEQILFDGIVLTEENVVKRFKQLSLCFHPDRTHWLPDRDKSIGNELMGLVSDCKDKLLKEFEKEVGIKGKFMFHQEKGYELWKIAKDYQYAQKKEWNKLQLLKKAEIFNLTNEELEEWRKKYIALAYEEYRASCKIVDRDKNLEKQIQLKEQVQVRGSMALCLYALGQLLEAQLCALAAVQLIFNNSQYATQEDLHKAKEILDKVKGMNSGKTGVSNSLALVNIGNKPLSLTVGQNYSFIERKKIKQSIDQELEDLATQLILKSDRSLVKYQSPKEEILRAKRRGNSHKVVGALTVTGGVGVGALVIGSAAVEVLQGIGLVTGVALGGPAVAIVGGLATIGLGIWAGHGLYKKGNKILEEPSIREKLNDIMKEALAYYDAGKHQEFIEALSKEYAANSRLLVLQSPADSIDSKEIIQSLLKHGFRADGIAYLLNLIGEALSGGKVKIQGLTRKDLISRAQLALEGTLVERLEEETAKLDSRIHVLRKQNLKSHFYEISDLFWLKDYTNIAKEHIQDAQEMPFQARLEEMRNISKLNIAIIRIVNGGEEEFEKASEKIQEVRRSINNNYQFISKSRVRLEVLEDFLWIISGQPINDEDTQAVSIPLAIQSTAVDVNDNSMTDLIKLNEGLEKANSDQERIKIYNRIATYYSEQAQKEGKADRLNSLRHWQEAQKNYQESLKLNPVGTEAAIGFATCLLQLSKYNRVIEFLKQNTNLSTLVDYWMIGSMAYRKKNNYNKAEEWIVEALKIDAKNQEADRQRNLVQKLKSKHQQILDVYKSSKLKQEEEYYFNVSRIDDNPVYRILSIDGGGIRGIMPALWLSEIERKTSRPISHLFNMASGTSTGAMIAAGLSAPFLHVSERWEEYTDSQGGLVRRQIKIETPSTYRPLYSASKILELYTGKSKGIFTTSGGRWFPWTNNLTASKYTKAGRYTMFNDYFGSTTLNQVLMELVIPAVSTENLTRTYLFNRYDSRQDPSKNETLVDTLMATTAAPTFFPAHTISGKGVFVDGGVQVNNPAMMAYKEALRYGIPKEKIFVLSLGTGSYIPDPLQPSLYEGQLFWAQNLHKVALPAQEGNTDQQMFQLLGRDHYQRWQVWLEEPITLDAHDKGSIDTLVEIGRQHLEELYASDDNTMNKLLEDLQK